MPKKKKTIKEAPDTNILAEPEDFDMPLTDDEDECPEILENIEPEEAIGTIFRNIHVSTLVTFALGIIFGIFYYIADKGFPEVFPGWSRVLIGFAAGLLVIFGASELIILGVQGVKDKTNLNPYIAGILSAIGAAFAELIIVSLLLIRSYTQNDPDLATTAIVLILTTVIINILFLGISMIFVSKDGPFKLPQELTMYETNLVLGIRVFTFLLVLYGLFYEFSDIRNAAIIATQYSRWVEIVIGASLLLVYGLFIFVLAKRFGKKSSTPQTLITEFCEDEEVEESAKSGQLKLTDKEDLDEEVCEPQKEKSKHRSHDALATLRRFPWFIIIIIFVIGAGGIVWGGELLASGIENGLHVLEVDLGLQVPILAYAVIVGLISTSPELIVTFRGLLHPDKETQKIGLINQVSAINQTFFLLFGFPFLLSGIIGIGIPVSINVTMVLGCIYIMSTAEKLMIMDDNHFDILEGGVMTILAIVSLLALAFMGGTS
ncbi:MAG: hypothetical protein ACTSXA_13920 [Candidatus Heimdallarchaeota archaeon]